MARHSERRPDCGTTLDLHLAADEREKRQYNDTPSKDVLRVCESVRDVKRRLQSPRRAAEDTPSIVAPHLALHCTSLITIYIMYYHLYHYYMTNVLHNSYCVSESVPSDYKQLWVE